MIMFFGFGVARVENKGVYVVIMAAVLTEFSLKLSIFKRNSQYLMKIDQNSQTMKF